MVLTHISLSLFCGASANIADPDQTPLDARLVRDSTVCLQNFIIAAFEYK